MKRNFLTLVLLLGGVLFLVSGNSAMAATNVSACGVLDNAGETYTLTQDVSSSGTCFAIADDNITFNLGGYMVTYGTGAGNDFFGIAMPPGYATDLTRAQYPGLPDSAFGGGVNAIIYNGSITQGSGNGTNSHAIYGRSGTEIYDTTTTVHGDDTDNIYFVWSNNVLIHDNIANNNSTVVTNRHQGKEVIGSLRDSGNTKIYNNTINGGPQWGIRLSHNSGGETGFEIYGNTIKQNARVANPYSIGAHADNTKVYNNIIAPVNGRGIHVQQDNIEVYGNTITVGEGPNAEYAGGWSHGIKLEGTNNSNIHDNVVTANAGGAFGSGYALDISVSANSNNEVHHNTFTAITSESGDIAGAVHLLAVDAGNGLDIHHNTFRSNNYLVYTDWDGANDVLFRTNTFETIGTLINFATLRFNTGTVVSQDIKFLNSSLGIGVSLEDVSYRSAGADYSYTVQQYIDIDTPGVGNASISITNQQGTVVSTGSTDSGGNATFIVDTYSYAGKPTIETSSIPHTITIFKYGYKTGSYVVTLDSSKTVTVQLVASSASEDTSVSESEYAAPGGDSSAPASNPVVARASKSFFAYDSRIRGGYRITAGNVLGDSSDEIISGTTSGMGPHVRVFDNQGVLRSQFFAYDRSLRYGVTVTACDVDGDGRDEIVTAQGKGGWPLVKIFDGYGMVINEGFFVLDGKYTGGVNLACGDTNGDGISEIVVSAMRGGGPHVLVYNAAGRVLTNFFAYDRSFRGGVTIATIDMDGDGRDEIVTGPQWGAPHVQIFQIRPNELKRLSPGFYAFDPSYRGGVSIAGVDTNGDGTKELIVGVGDNATPFVKVFNILEQWQSEFFVYATNFLGGIQLAGGDVDGDGKDELLTIPRGRGGPHIRIINVDEV